ncbi:hypothetical protein BGX26_008551 [Mortierella sp. AD094]|nr:hypothetical protein BGX26_008551 [Mortierella sp. AD094]
MSPVSRQAKLVHLIGYVDRQRELVSSEDETDEPQQPVVEKASLMIMTKSGRLIPASADVTHASANIPQPISKNSMGPTVSPLSAPQRRYESKQLYSSQRSVPDALDPCLALPRALPRKMNSSSDLSLYRDTIYNGAIENDYESMPIQDWRQDQSPRRFNAFDRPIVFRSQTEDDFELHRRPLMRQPTVQSMDRSIKPGRLGGFSSFLTKGGRQRLRRQGSHHTLQRKSFDDCDSVEDRSHLHSISYKSGRALKPAKMSSSGDSETQSDDPIKPRSTVKRMFLDVFKKSSSKPGPEAASGSYREEQLHPEFLHESYDKQERQLFNLWSPPHVVAADDDDEEEESSSSDQSPRTIQSPWTPDSPSSSATLRHSASFNRLFPYLDDCSKAEEAAGYEGDNQKALEPSDQLVPIANLIRELAAFGLDYVNHNPCSNQRTEQANDFQSAGNYVVAAM